MQVAKKSRLARDPIEKEMWEQFVLLFITSIPHLHDVM